MRSLKPRRMSTLSPVQMVLFAKLVTISPLAQQCRTPNVAPAIAAAVCRAIASYPRSTFSR